MSIYPSKYPRQYPERLQLYTMPTPNGRKISIALEIMQLPYEAHRVDILNDDQYDEDYVRISPNSKIPTLIDPDGPGGEPLVIMESGAILVHLGEKSGKLYPRDARLRSETLQWLMFQVGNVGPLFGQFGHFFKFAKGKTDGYGAQRYTKEVKRLLGVLNRRLETREFLVGDSITIADVATVPWIMGLDFYEGKEHVDYASFEHVEPWVQRCHEVPGFRAGLFVGAE